MRPPATPAAVGRRIAYFRERARLSQAALAFRAGVHPTMITLWERGMRGIYPDTLAQVAAVLRVDVLDLIGGW